VMFFYDFFSLLRMVFSQFSMKLSQIYSLSQKVIANSLCDFVNPTLFERCLCGVVHRATASLRSVIFPTNLRLNEKERSLYLPLSIVLTNCLEKLAKISLKRVGALCHTSTQLALIGG